MNRAERARAAGALRAQGYKFKDIAATLGISRSYASELCADPDGAKVVARKASYGGECEDCGRTTDGSNGAKSAPTRCQECANRRNHEERYWTPERVVQAIHRFVREHGRRPMSTEWLHGSHGLTGDGYPHTAVVLREHGSWNAAMEAAGQEVFEVGKYERTPETRRKMSEVQLARWGVRNKYGELARIGGFAVGATQLAALDELNGCSRSEHFRRALDLYLASVTVSEIKPVKRKRWLFSRAA